MGLEKLINREIKITIGVVLFVSILFIALSYAIFKVDKSGASDVIKFGDISLSFCKDATCASNVNNIGNIIGTETDSNGNTVYSKIYPVADPVTNDDWNNLKPYIFTLTNTGSLPLYVSIFLERDMTAGVISDGTSEYSEFVNDDQVKIGFGVQGETPAIGLYSDYLNTTDNNHKIASNIQIGVGETKIFNLYAWLKSDAQNASLGKYFVTQISARGEYLPDGENTEIDENLKTIEIDFKEGTIDKNIKQVQKGNSVEFTLTPSDTSVTLDKLNITCLSGTVPTVSGNTLTISNVQKNEFCQVYSTPTILSQILKDNPTRNTRTDFNTTFTKTNTGILYKATESIAGNTPKDVYYFAGDAKNNWVKFGKYQNDLIRYRGYYSTSSNSFRDYPTMDECTSASSYNINCTEYKYANTGDDIYWRIIRTNHDGSIRLLYSGTSHNTTAGYIATSLFTDKAKMDPMYAGYMYGTTGSLENNRLNTNDSTIKTYIDNWYNNNLSSYTKYISTEAVYCNDRELAPGQTYSTSSSFDYAPSGRLDTNKPTYNCTNNKDAFSGNNGEAKLTYPIGLMTADEIAYAGGKVNTKLPSPYAWYYLNSAGGSITGSTWWWLMSPVDSRDSLVGVPDVYVVNGSGPGHLGSVFAITKYGVRPAISLKTCTLWTSGNGAPETPYEISTTSGC